MPTKTEKKIERLSVDSNARAGLALRPRWPVLPQPLPFPKQPIVIDPLPYPIDPPTI